MWQKIAVYTVTLIKWLLVPALLFLAFRFGRLVEKEGIEPIEALKSLPERVIGSNGDASTASGTTRAAATGKTTSNNGRATEVYYEPSEPVGASPVYYTVLVGSFKDRADTRGLRQQLMSHRINNSVLEMDNKFHVVVGKFSNSNKAGKTLDKVHRKGFSDARIIGI